MGAKLGVNPMGLTLALKGCNERGLRQCGPVPKEDANI